jgi:hypothetical protein
MLKLEITIEDVSSLTEHEKEILAVIAKKDGVAPITHEEVVIEKPAPKRRAPKVEVEAVSPELPSAPKAEEKPVEVETPKEEIVEEHVETPKEEVAFSIEDLNNYARSVAKPEYAAHYRALLNEYGVSTFKQIPQDKVLEAKAKLDDIVQNVV